MEKKLEAKGRRDWRRKNIGQELARVWGVGLCAKLYSTRVHGELGGEGEGAKREGGGAEAGSRGNMVT